MELARLTRNTAVCFQTFNNWCLGTKLFALWYWKWIQFLPRVERLMAFVFPVSAHTHTHIRTHALNSWDLLCVLTLGCACFSVTVSLPTCSTPISCRSGSASATGSLSCCLSRVISRCILSLFSLGDTSSSKICSSQLCHLCRGNRGGSWPDSSVQFSLSSAWVMLPAAYPCGSQSGLLWPSFSSLLFCSCGKGTWCQAQFGMIAVTSDTIFRGCTTWVAMGNSNTNESHQTVDIFSPFYRYDGISFDSVTCDEPCCTAMKNGVICHG